MGVRVIIATTEGPALIQRIAAEDSDIPPVICLNGTTETLPISEAYGRFVRRGTGVVAMLTGHDSYRIDLDRPVDGGSSWQLGVLLAHLLHGEGRLAGPDEPAEITVFATGEVDRDLALRPVGHIDRKLTASAGIRQTLADQGAPWLFLVPTGDASSDPTVTAAASFAEAARLLNVAAPGTVPIKSPPAEPPSTAGRRRRLITAVSILMLMAAGTIWQRDRIEALFTAPAPSESAIAETSPPPVSSTRTTARAPAVTIQELTAPAGFSCRSLRFVGLDLIERTPSPLTADRDPGQNVPEICKLRYRIILADPSAGEWVVFWRSGPREVTARAGVGPDTPVVFDVDLTEGHAREAVLEVRWTDGEARREAWRHRIAR